MSEVHTAREMGVDWGAVAARVFKEESARILAGLIRLSGSFDWAAEAMQDAFTRALAEWPEKSVPTNPGAWITTVARRRIVDRARREATRTEYEASVAAHVRLLASGDDTAEQEPMPEYPDDRLRLMFTCCHPALNIEARIALTLRTLGGLQTPEIARAFLVSETTMAQRLVRDECDVCTKTHAGVAALAYRDEARVSAALNDLDTAPIAEPLRATLHLLRKLTREHAVDADQMRAALTAGVSPEQIEDALAVCFAFNVVDRLSRAFGFVVSGPKAFEAGARFLLARGYR